MDSTGEWQQLTIPEGQIAVLAGYTLERATCGLVRAAKHCMVYLQPVYSGSNCTLPPHCSIGIVQHKALFCPFSCNTKPKYIQHAGYR